MQKNKGNHWHDWLLVKAEARTSGRRTGTISFLFSNPFLCTEMDVEKKRHWNLGRNHPYQGSARRAPFPLVLSIRGKLVSLRQNANDRPNISVKPSQGTLDSND
jgi:hypothetical protein